MRCGTLKEAITLAVAHLKWAHDQGLTNAELWREMGKTPPTAEVNDFETVGQIAQWYIFTYWDVAAGTNEKEAKDVAVPRNSSSR